MVVELKALVGRFIVVKLLVAFEEVAERLLLLFVGIRDDAVGIRDILDKSRMENTNYSLYLTLHYRSNYIIALLLLPRRQRLIFD